MEEEGEGRSGRGSFVGRLKEKGRTSIWQLHLETFYVLLCHLYGLAVSIPFCFSLKFCQDNTAVTTPNTVTVAIHSATKEAVVAMKTPEEGGTEISTN